MATGASLEAAPLTSGGVLGSGFMIRKRVPDQVPCQADSAGIRMCWRVQNDLSACMGLVILNEMGVVVMEFCIGFEKGNGKDGLGSMEMERGWNEGVGWREKGSEMQEG